MNTRTDSGDSQEGDSEIREFVAGLLYDAATDDYLELPSIPWDSTRPEPDIELLPVIKYIDSLTESHQVYLATKWCQNKAPYNSNLPDSLNGVAGCVTIAIAQIVYHNRYPLFIDNANFNWHRISAFEYRNRNNTTLIDDTLNKIAVADFIKQIAIEVNAGPQNGQTGSNFVDAYNFFANHYLNAIPMMYNEDSIKSMIIQHKPVYIRGENYSTGADGHAWVIDGYRKYEDYAHNLNTGEIYKADTLYREYFHCNMGWGGLCDGYYLSKTFDATKTLLSKYRVDSIGDFRHKFDGNYSFDNNFRIISYDKINPL